MPPTPPSDSSTGKKASTPTALRSRLSKTGSTTRGSTSAATSSLSLKTSNNVHTRSGSGGIRKPTVTAAGTTDPMGPPTKKKPVNEKFDNLFLKSPVPRAISKLLSNSQSTSSANSNPTVPSSLRRSIGAGPSASASTTAISSTIAAAGVKKTRSVITKKPTTATPASTRKTPKQPTKPTTTPGANGTVLVDFTLPNDSQEQALPTPMDEPSDDDDDCEDIIPARATIKSTSKPQARTNLRSSVIPGTPEKLSIATRTNSVRGTNGKHVKRAKQAQKGSTGEKKVVESPKGVMRNTASSRARAATNAGTGAKSGIKARDVQAGRTSAASVGTAAVAMPTTPAAPPSRETRSSGLSSLFKSQARGHINAWAEAQKRRSPEPTKEKENGKKEIIPPTPEVHIPTLTRSLTRSSTKNHNLPSPTASPPKSAPTRKPHSSTLAPGFVIPPGILDETGSLWDSGRRKSRRSLGTPTAPITNSRRRMTIAGGSAMSTSVVDVSVSRNGKRKSMGDVAIEPIGKKARVANPDIVETLKGGASGSEDAGKSAPAKRGNEGKGKEKVYINTDFEFSDIEV